MDAMLLKGLTEASLTEFNSLYHSYTRLNRSLPAHARLGDALIAEKLCSVCAESARASTLFLTLSSS
eukprot:5044743-Pleurochrysis_carterae.AAC.1